MMIVMDSEGAGKKNTKKSLDFFKHVTSSMDVSQETIQIGMIQPEECIPPSESFRYITIINLNMRAGSSFSHPYSLNV